MIHLFLMLFVPEPQDGPPIPRDIFGRASRWVMRRRWAQRLCAAWVLAWLGLMVWLAVQQLSTILAG